MSNTEDYLDGLLNSMEGKGSHEVEETDQISDTENRTEGESMSSEDEFLDSFEKEILSGEDADDFMRQFEKELDGGETTASAREKQDDVFFDSIDGIVNSVKEQLQGEGTSDSVSGMDDLMVDTIGNLTDAAATDPDGAPAETTEPASDFVDDDTDLMDLLQSEGDFSDIGDMLKADEEDKVLADATAEAEVQPADVAETPGDTEEETKGKKRRKKEKKQQKAEDKGEKQGFVQKISQLLFGEDEEEDEQKKTAEPVKVAPLAPSIEELSDENLQILQELEGSPDGGAEETAPVEEEDEKEKKKREKAAKKEQAKKEKAAKKEQAKKEKAAKKAQKVKKPKPPKEPDNTPPLPKKPVVLSFVMAASFLALVLIGTNLFGYSHSMEEAERAYDLGDYKTAYAQVSGMEIKEADQATYEKYRIMANAGGEYSAFQSFMEQGIYDMALDSLIRTIGRCDKYSVEAESYGCARELSNVRSQAVSALAGFGLTEERAMELYAVSERENYSAELYAALAAAGLSVD